MSVYLDLFLSFAKIGLFTFGGGYAMLSIIEETCVEIKKWITSDEMMNITVIAESTPGPVAINCSTFVGYKQKGILGAIVATLGMVLPSFIIIHLIANFLDNFLEIEIIAHAFKGIKIGVGILILDAALKMMKKMKSKKLRPFIFLFASAIVMISIDVFALNFSSVSLMLLMGIINFCIFIIKDRKAGTK